jgi:predicted GIY-YIG superfamily endonuclease
METIDYSESCVYRFMKEDIIYYIGSTNNFTKRYNSHKSHCNSENDHNHNFVHWDGAERGYP